MPDNATINSIFEQLRPLITPLITRCITDDTLRQTLIGMFSADEPERRTAGRGSDAFIADKMGSLTLTSTLASAAQRALIGCQRLMIDVAEMSPSERMIALTPALTAVGNFAVTQSGTDDILAVGLGLASLGMLGLTNVSATRRLRLNQDIDSLRIIQSYCARMVTLSGPRVLSAASGGDISALILGLASQLSAAAGAQISLCEEEKTADGGSTVEE